ncbi:tetratricopeptide repeat protein [Amycolatopsis japonica]|uniref:tetratricopeptide repeat protein n=1 Tax=Amycolatopsis japonica TaxID=208439 RepID=UPI0033CE6948
MNPDRTDVGEVPPEPLGAGSFDELAARLNTLRGWYGVSYRELHRRVVRGRRAAGNPDLPVFNTVYRCLRPGRRRVDADLVADIVRALTTDEAVVARWRQVCQVIAGLTADSSWVTVAGELPADSTEFVGRHAELAAITCPGDDERRSTVVIDGMAGVGKTSLAVRAAHRLAHRDGVAVRLWADLRGYDADRAPADPLAVLDEFLRRLGVPGGEIHRLGPADRQATYRRLLADRHPVVVLDNAADADQVRPLLPDRPGGVVLITSRRRLTELENAIGLSYADLPAEAALLLRLLAIHPGRDVDTRAAAALAGVDLGTAEELLGELVASSLVQRRVQDRFGLHDVVRLYAAGLARDVDAASARQAALGRLFSYYRHTACRAMDRYAPHERDRRPAVSTSDVPAPDFADLAAATEWLDAERHNLVGITALAEEQGRREDAAMMSPILNRYLYNALLFADAEIVHGIAIRAADPLIQASAHMSLGAVYLRSNRYQESIDQLKQALERYDAAGDRTSWARALNNLGNAFDRLSDFAAAEDCYRQALLVHRATGNRTSESRALGNLGNSAMRVGDWDKAATYLDEALAIMLEVGDRVGECLTYGNLGTVREQQGHSAEALGHYRRALVTAREFGYRFPETEALLHIGVLLARLGEHDDALTQLTEALDLARRNSLGEFEVKALNGIGIALGGKGDAAGSIARHREALAVAEKLGDRYEQAQAHKGIERGTAVIGDTGTADEHGRKARALLTEIGLR